MNNKNWYDEVKEDFIKNINDSYTLNLAVSILDDRKKILNDNLKLQQQLQQKEDIINKAKEELKRHLNAKSYGNHKYELFGREYLEDLLKILDNKGEMKDE